jgi:hypothetical protein
MLITGTTITTVGHYKDAAERHLQVCTILFKQLDYPQNFRNPNKFQNILAELYYLSGYIVECVINYKYLDHKGFKDSDNYDQRHHPTIVPCWDIGVHLKGHFRFTNNMASSSCEKILGQLPSSDLPDYLKNLGNVSTITLVGQDIVKEKMQRYWDPSVRYAYESTGLLFTSLSVDEIKIYHKAAKDLYNDLI